MTTFQALLHDMVPQEDVCCKCRMTAAQINNSIKPCLVPQVRPMVQENFERGIKYVQATQRWTRAQMSGDPDSTGILLPIETEGVVLMPQPEAHRYVVAYMNAEARRMLREGWTPRQLPEGYSRDMIMPGKA